MSHATHLATVLIDGPHCGECWRSIEVVDRCAIEGDRAYHVVCYNGRRDEYGGKKVRLRDYEKKDARFQQNGECPPDHEVSAYGETTGCKPRRKGRKH